MYSNMQCIKYAMYYNMQCITICNVLQYAMYYNMQCSHFIKDILTINNHLFSTGLVGKGLLGRLGFFMFGTLTFLTHTVFEMEPKLVNCGIWARVTDFFDRV
ncbi:hypothetical protein CHS0354_041768 [Potamilus streckersoni]|uniref:Uncharacterized protein n=1 Tax=Potamilus streckersoni TaxID=2493646 RepID=A0AAE0W6B0_9BIVA|nr:hypothetical protein CHS0354_041768 [Potamilus streckersoni]